jgi:hypothetical protein
MKRIVEYQVIRMDPVVGGGKHSAPRTRTLDKMIEDVNQKIREGWQPLGGVATDNQGRGLYQAVVRYEEE